MLILAYLTQFKLIIKMDDVIKSRGKNGGDV